ncbi:hypothetical protein GG344DRAFT_65410 [Lentinula edodes]|nr:hypothetical protein GG344DRAFT_65410 [Lentinula edodes]
MRHNLKRGEEGGFVFLADIKLQPREGEAGWKGKREEGKRALGTGEEEYYSFDDPGREVGTGIEREPNVGELGGGFRFRAALEKEATDMSRKFCLRVWPVEGLDNANFPFKNEVCQVRMAHRAHLGIILDLLEAIETLRGALGHILIRSYFSTSTHPFYKYSTHGDDVENEVIGDRTPGFSLPSDFFRTPVGALKFEWFGEYPDTDEDVFHVQMPLPDGTEWKIRIFPSGRTNMSIFGYFLQPVGDDGVPRVPEGFKVRLALGGPPVESWEQRFKGCLNLNLPPVITNEKWYFKEGQKVAICKNDEAVGEITIPVNAERERERQRQRNNGRSVEVIRLEAVWVEAVWVEVVRVEVV